MWGRFRIRSWLVAVAGFVTLVAACGSGGLFSDRELPGEDCADIDLADYADTDSEVRLTIGGPIVSRDENTPVRVAVDASYRRLHLLQGYDEQDIAERMRWENDIEAYREFLAALDFEGFAQCRGVPESVNPDGVGVCPKNGRMVAELYENGLPVMRLWWADCDGGTGTLAGKARTIEELFQAQIPDYETLTANVEL